MQNYTLSSEIPGQLEPMLLSLSMYLINERILCTCKEEGEGRRGAAGEVRGSR